MRILLGDCIEVLKTVESNSIDSLITDPPAGISFMGKDWDGDKGGAKEWIAWMTEVMAECHRVLKPGAHGLVWAIPRTSHWTGTALEMAGFEVRDCITHLFGSGFPKSMNLQKAGAGDDWEGWGTALKPAAEFWWLVRKKASEKTVAANVLKWGVGGLNIDGCRVVSPDIEGKSRDHKGAVYEGVAEGYQRPGKSSYTHKTNWEAQAGGRFPANLVLSHNPDCEDDQCSLGCAAAMLDEQSGVSKSTAHTRGNGIGDGFHGSSKQHIGVRGVGDSGGASRFFYCAKTSTSERNAAGDNKHPTVKPQKLMRYLCRLITPPGGVVLDPFMGSGSTGVAAKAEGFGFIGIERESEYHQIAQRRISWIKA